MVTSMRNAFLRTVVCQKESFGPKGHLTLQRVALAIIKLCLFKDIILVCRNFCLSCKIVCSNQLKVLWSFFSTYFYLTNAAHFCLRKIKTGIWLISFHGPCLYSTTIVQHEDEYKDLMLTAKSPSKNCKHVIHNTINTWLSRLSISLYTHTSYNWLWFLVITIIPLEFTAINIPSLRPFFLQSLHHFSAVKSG